MAAPSPGFTLPKSERLSGKTAVSALVSKGKWSVQGVLKYCVLPTDTGVCRIMVSVPKRHFKRAVRRNLLKRRIREAYRTRKSLLEGCSLDILFFYNSTDIADSASIAAEVGEILSALSSRYSPSDK